MKLKLIIISFFSIFIGVTMLTASSEAVLGFVISERCENDVEDFLTKWKGDGINITYSEVDNNLGGFYTYFTKYVNLTSTKYDKKLLAAIMVGALKKCGRDSVIESRLERQELLSDIKRYVKVLKKKGVSGSLIIEINNSDVLIHVNSEHARDMVRSYKESKGSDLIDLGDKPR